MAKTPPSAGEAGSQCAAQHRFPVVQQQPRRTSPRLTKVWGRLAERGVQTPTDSGDMSATSRRQHHFSDATARIRSTPRRVRERRPRPFAAYRRRRRRGDERSSQPGGVSRTTGRSQAPAVDRHRFVNPGREVRPLGQPLTPDGQWNGRARPCSISRRAPKRGFLHRDDRRRGSRSETASGPN